MLSETIRPIRSLDAQPQIVSEDLYVVRGNDAFLLGDTEAAIWRRCDGQQTIEAISDSLALEFDAPPEQVIEDVKGFVTALSEAGLVTLELSE